MCELRVADWTGRVAGFDLGLGFQSRDLLVGLVPAWWRYAGLEIGFGFHGCDLLTKLKAIGMPGLKGFARKVGKWLIRFGILSEARPLADGEAARPAIRSDSVPYRRIETTPASGCTSIVQ